MTQRSAPPKTTINNSVKTAITKRRTAAVSAMTNAATSAAGAAIATIKTGTRITEPAQLIDDSEIRYSDISLQLQKIEE